MENPGRRSLVAQLIRELGHDLRKLEPGRENDIHIATLLNGPASVEERWQLAEIAADPSLLPSEVVDRILPGVTAHLRRVGLLHNHTAERDIKFISDLLIILKAPDADVPRAEQAQNILACAMKVIEPAIAMRQPVMRQKMLLEEFKECILGLVAKVQQGALAVDDAISLISAETTWLLCSLRVDKRTLESIPAMDAEILRLLDPKC